MNAMKKNLIVDVGALVVYLVVAAPWLTGVPAHEWLGIGVLVVFLVHVVLHVDWVRDVLLGLKGASWVARGNFALAILILVAFMAVMVSGLGISGTILPTLGFVADGYYFWNPLHSIAAKALLALLLVHVAVHWKWFCSCFKKEKREKNGNDA